MNYSGRRVPDTQVAPRNADQRRSPLVSESFEFVFYAGLTKHAPEPAALTSEPYRVLRPSGRGYAGLPLFYSPVGRHHLKPCHLLGKRNATRFVGGNVGDYTTGYAHSGLCRRTVPGGCRLLIQGRFESEKLSTKLTALSLAKLPPLGELLTWYVPFSFHTGPR